MAAHGWLIQVFSNILVAYNGTDSGHGALDEAIELAAASRADVHLVGVAHPSTDEVRTQAGYRADTRPGHEDVIRISLRVAVEAFERRGCNVQTSLVIDSNPAAAIHALAISTMADLILLGH